MNVFALVGHRPAASSAVTLLRWQRLLAGALMSIACSFGLGGTALGQYGQSEWTGAGVNVLWSNTANWNITPNAYRFFTDAGVGPSTADAYRTGIIWLRVTNSTGTHAVNLNSGTLAMSSPQIEIGLNATGAMQFSNGSFSAPQTSSQPLRLGRAQSAAAAGTLIGTSSLVATMGFNGLSTVGYADSTFNGAATLNMADSDNGSLAFEGGSLKGLRAGYANSTGAATSSMSFGDNWTFNFGTSGARAEVMLGYSASTGTASSSFTTGTGGSFTAYTSTLNVAAGSTSTSKSSVVDLSGINNGVINHVGGGNDSFHIGRGTGSGTLQLGSNWTLTATTSHLIAIGTDGGTGSLTGTNLTFSGSTAYLYVGAPNTTSAAGYGTLDMGGGSMGSGLVVSAYLRIGNGGSSTGTVKFGSGLVSSVAQTDIGDSDASGVEGVMELRGTQFTSGASAVVNVFNSGRLNIFVSNTSSGLILTRANSGALNVSGTVAAGNGIYATFLNNPTGYDYLGTAGQHDAIYWALKWSGDQTSTLTSLINAGKIDWSTAGLTLGLSGATPQSIYDAGSDSTYLGIYVTSVPEPGSLALASGGLALAGWSLRRRRRGGRAA